VGGVFRQAGAHPDVGPKLEAAGVTLRLELTDPDATLTVRMHEPLEVIEGPSDEPADVTLTLSADHADAYWRGEYNLAVGLARKQVHAQGPVNKIMRLVPLTRPLFPIYRELTASKDARVPA
jgi:hypothetical protein